MLSVEDLFDTDHIEQVKQDLIEECHCGSSSSGVEVLALHVPKPMFHLKLNNEDADVEPRFQDIAQS